MALTTALATSLPPIATITGICITGCLCISLLTGWANALSSEQPSPCYTGFERGLTRPDLCGIIQTLAKQNKAGRSKAKQYKPKRKSR